MKMRIIFTAMVLVAVISAFKTRSTTFSHKWDYVASTTIAGVDYFQVLDGIDYATLEEGEGSGNYRCIGATHYCLAETDQTPFTLAGQFGKRFIFKNINGVQEPYMQIGDLSY